MMTAALHNWEHQFCIHLKLNIWSRTGKVVVVSSPHQSPRCGVWRVDKVWKFWLPAMSVGNPATKRQLPFGSTGKVSIEGV